MSREMGREEQIGFHKGAVSTLAKERQELVRMVGVVEQLMQLHVKGLQELGVDLSKMASQQQQINGQSAEKQSKGPNKKIEDMLR